MPIKTTSPFSLDNDSAYRRWRARKLETRPQLAQELLVEIDNPAALSGTERARIAANCKRANLCFYRSTAAFDDRRTFKRLCGQLGLDSLVGNPCADEEKISRIEAAPGRRYIPYTDAALDWHTDGYYNAGDDTIRAFAMHCVRRAASGGGNRYLDPEISYILLRDDNPEYIKALMHPQAMTVKANLEQGRVVRAARSAPVFAVDAATGALLMRYSRRAQRVRWSEACRDAAARLDELLSADADAYAMCWTLDAGEGVICNNVLHDRRKFSNPGGASGRLLYRARFRNRCDGADGAAPAAECTEKRRTTVC